MERLGTLVSAVPVTVRVSKDESTLKNWRRSLQPLMPSTTRLRHHLNPMTTSNYDVPGAISSLTSYLLVSCADVPILRNPSSLIPSRPPSTLLPRPLILTSPCPLLPLILHQGNHLTNSRPSAHGTQLGRRPSSLTPCDLPLNIS